MTLPLETLCGSVVDSTQRPAKARIPRPRSEVSDRRPGDLYKGLDGDEFHSSAHWNGSALVFDTVEHEGGRQIPETTVWILSEDRNNLQVKEADEIRKKRIR
jgi:hypothetical protein